MASQKYLNKKLYEACGEGDIEAVRNLVERGASVQDIEGVGAPLVAAVNNGHLEVMEYLVQLGADVDVGYGLPLHVAVTNNRRQMLRFLIDSGADIQKYGKKALGAAVMYGHLKMLDYLVKEVGLDITDTQTITNGAINQTERFDGVRRLVELGADIKKMPYVLPAAACTQEKICSLEDIKFFVRSGADIHAYDGSDVALRLAANHGRLDIVEFLVGEGCNAKIALKSGNKEVKAWAESYINSQDLSNKLQSTLSKKPADTKIKM